MRQITLIRTKVGRAARIVLNWFLCFDRYHTFVYGPVVCYRNHCIQVHCATTGTQNIQPYEATNTVAMTEN
jgi:hypothetical protein